MDDVRQSMMEYASGLIEELRARAEAIREETLQFDDYRDGRYAGRFDGIAAKLEGAAAKAEGIVARLEADRVGEDVKRQVKDELKMSFRASFGQEPAVSEPTEDEKLQILQMLEQGAITIEQAEELLSAL